MAMTATTAQPSKDTSVSSIHARAIGAKAKLFSALGETHGATERITQDALKALELANEAYAKAKQAQQIVANAMATAEKAAPVPLGDFDSLGQKVPESDATNPAAIAALCGANYHIEQRPLFIKTNDGNFSEVPNRSATVRGDTEQVTNIVADARFHETNEPQQLFEMLVAQLATEKLSISHAAILAGGARVAVSSILPKEYSFSVGSDKDMIDQYITLLIDSNGAKRFRRSSGTIRQINGSTITHSLSAAIHKSRLRSITTNLKLTPAVLKKVVFDLTGGNSENDAPGLAGELARAGRIAKTQKKAFKVMSETKMEIKDVEKFFCDVLEINASQLDHNQPDGKPVVSTKSKNMLSALMNAYENAPGSETGHGTVYGALNAVTYYATHQKTVRDTSGAGVFTARFASNLDGDAAALKARALLLATALATA